MDINIFAIAGWSIETSMAEVRQNPAVLPSYGKKRGGKYAECSKLYKYASRGAFSEPATSGT